MRYPAIITREGEHTLAVFHFDDGTECATSAEPGESIEALAEDALTGRLTSYLEDEKAPPGPPLLLPPGHVLWVAVASKLAHRWARTKLELQEEKEPHMLPRNRAPTSPGEVLSKEFLEPRSLTSAQFAAKAGISVELIDLVLAGKQAVTAEIALKIAKVYDTRPEFWLNLQTGVDLWKAKQERDGHV